MERAIDDTILRSLATESIATLLLVQGIGFPTISSRPEMMCIDRCISPSLDGSVDIRTVFLRDAIGIGVLNDSGTTLSWTGPLESPAEPNIADLPHLLRQRTGLAIEVLAKAVGVSKVTYHKWLNGAGISEDSRDRLVELYKTLDVLVAIKSDLRKFLDLQTSAGTPLELLSRRQDALVLGLATRGGQVLETLGFAMNSPREGLRQVRPLGWAHSVDRDRRDDFGSTARLEDTTDSLAEVDASVVSYVLFKA